ncbi:MAG TPA: hypothetical protein VFR94_15640 [Nitrososphaeraceae archaeon]|nr:hypothetical protein [Nitrososphaeraceae archaeon]
MVEALIMIITLLVFASLFILHYYNNQNEIDAHIASKNTTDVKLVKFKNGQTKEKAT